MYLLLLETDVPSEWTSSVVQRIRCDHHRTGDPGFDCAPRHYVEGSMYLQLRRLFFGFYNFSLTPRELLIGALDHAPNQALRGLLEGVDREDALRAEATSTAHRFDMDVTVCEGEVRERRNEIEEHYTLYREHLRAWLQKEVKGKPISMLWFKWRGEKGSFMLPVYNLGTAIAESLEYFQWRSAALASGKPCVIFRIMPDGRLSPMFFFPNKLGVQQCMRYGKEHGVEVFGVEDRGYAGFSGIPSWGIFHEWSLYRKRMGIGYSRSIPTEFLERASFRAA